MYANLLMTELLPCVRRKWPLSTVLNRDEQTKEYSLRVTRHDHSSAMF